jgi:hypothetical protein
MTIPRVLEINQYQAKSPPLHVMVAAYLGIGSKSSKLITGDQAVLKPIDPNDQQFAKLKSEFNGRK